MRNAKIENVETRCKFNSADLSKHINFSNRYFDVIVTCQSLSFITHRKHQQFFQEINRILKNDGKIVFFEPRSFYKRDINNVKKYFVNMNHDIKIIPIKEFIGNFIFFSHKF